jgi:hypothetical protein
VTRGIEVERASLGGVESGHVLSLLSSSDSVGIGDPDCAEGERGGRSGARRPAQP